MSGERARRCAARGGRGASALRRGRRVHGACAPPGRVLRCISLAFRYPLWNTYLLDSVWVVHSQPGVTFDSHSVERSQERKGCLKRLTRGLPVQQWQAIHSFSLQEQQSKHILCRGSAFQVQICHTKLQLRAVLRLLLSTSSTRPRGAAALERALQPRVDHLPGRKWQSEWMSSACLVYWAATAASC